MLQPPSNRSLVKKDFLVESAIMWPARVLSFPLHTILPTAQWNNARRSQCWSARPTTHCSASLQGHLHASARCVTSIEIHSKSTVSRLLHLHPEKTFNKYLLLSITVQLLNNQKWRPCPRRFLWKNKTPVTTATKDKHTEPGTSGKLVTFYSLSLPT